MSESCHVYPVSDRPGIGHHIIEMIVSCPLISTEDGITLWNGNAPEQLEALVASHLRARGFSEEEISKI